MMKVILIGLAGIAVIVCVLVVLFVVKVRGVVNKSYGEALYSSVGAWTRVVEYAHAQGRSDYIAHAEKTLSFAKSNLESWRRSAASGTDFAALEKVQARAYETTDQNIKGGENPLAFLDKPTGEK